MSYLDSLVGLFLDRCSAKGPKNPSPSQGQLQRWTEHSKLIFENLKPVEISKTLFNII